MLWKDKYYLIVGASSGIGQEVAEYLDSLGANIVMVARNAEKMELIKRGMKDTTKIIQCDVSNVEDIPKIFDDLRQDGIKLDGLVYSAGIVQPEPIKAASAEEFQNIMQVNTIAFFEFGKLFSLKKNSNDNASIVTLSSIASLHCCSGQGTYAASKSAVNALVKVMSQEFLRRHIRVNAILPALVDTKMGRDWNHVINNDESEETSVQPFGGIPARQIAYLCEFLLSDKSNYITGTLIPVGAGTIV